MCETIGWRTVFTSLRARFEKRACIKDRMKKDGTISAVMKEMRRLNIFVRDGI